MYSMTPGSSPACNRPRRLTFRLLRGLSRIGEPPENRKSPREAVRTGILCSLRKYRTPRCAERRRRCNTIRAGFRRFLVWQREDFSYHNLMKSSCANCISQSVAILFAFGLHCHRQPHLPGVFQANPYRAVGFLRRRQDRCVCYTTGVRPGGGLRRTSVSSGFATLGVFSCPLAPSRHLVARSNQYRQILCGSAVSRRWGSHC